MGGRAPKQEQQQQQQSWSNLNSLFGTASNAANAFGASGQGTLDQVKQYFSTLLGGDSSAIAKAIGPAANAAHESSDAQKKQRADMGTSRTGGDVAANQQSEDNVRKEIDTLVGQAQPAAAANLASLGEADVSAMLSALGLGISATGEAGSQISSDINSQREASAQMWSSLIGGAAKIGTAFIPVH